MFPYILCGIAALLLFIVIIYKKWYATRPFDNNIIEKKLQGSLKDVNATTNLKINGIQFNNQNTKDICDSFNQIRRRNLNNDLLSSEQSNPDYRNEILFVQKKSHYACYPEEFNTDLGEGSNDILQSNIREQQDPQLKTLSLETTNLLAENCSLQRELETVNLKYDILRTDFHSYEYKLKHCLKAKEVMKKDLGLQKMKVALDNESHVNMYRIYEEKIERLKEEIKNYEAKVCVDTEKYRDIEVSRVECEVLLAEAKENLFKQVTDNEQLKKVNMNLLQKMENLQKSSAARENDLVKANEVLNSQNAQLRGIISRLGKNIENKAWDIHFGKEYEAKLNNEILRLYQERDSLQKQVLVNNSRLEYEVKQLQDAIRGKIEVVDSLNKVIDELRLGLVGNSGGAIEDIPHSITAARHQIFERLGCRNRNLSCNCEVGYRAGCRSTELSTHKEEELQYFFRRIKSDTSLNLEKKILDLEDTGVNVSAVVVNQISELIIENKRMEDQGLQGDSTLVMVAEMVASVHEGATVNADPKGNMELCDDEIEEVLRAQESTYIPVNDASDN